MKKLLPACAALLFAAAMTGSAGEAAKVPQRIVSLSPAATEQIFLLGAQDRLVGCTTYCERPEAAKQKDKVGSVIETNLEKVVSLNPDLVIGSSLTKPATVGKLKELGFKVEIFRQPKDFESLYMQFVELGTLIGEEDKAMAIAKGCKEQISRISALASSFGERPSVLIQIGANPLYVAGSDSFVNGFIVNAGARNVLGEAKSGAYSKESIVKDSPDFIYIAAMGLLGEQERNEWMRLDSISAVKKKQIVVSEPSKICSPNPAELPSTLLDIAILFHPSHKEELAKLMPTPQNPP